MSIALWRSASRGAQPAAGHEAERSEVTSTVSGLVGEPSGAQCPRRRAHASARGEQVDSRAMCKV